MQSGFGMNLQSGFGQLAKWIWSRNAKWIWSTLAGEVEGSGGPGQARCAHGLAALSNSMGRPPELRSFWQFPAPACTLMLGHDVEAANSSTGFQRNQITWAGERLRKPRQRRSSVSPATGMLLRSTTIQLTESKRESSIFAWTILVQWDKTLIERRITSVA